MTTSETGLRTCTRTVAWEGDTANGRPMEPVACERPIALVNGVLEHVSVGEDALCALCPHYNHPNPCDDCAGPGADHDFGPPVIDLGHRAEGE